MNITIEESACKKAGLSIPEILFLTLVKTGVSLTKLIDDLIAKEAIVEVPSPLGAKLAVTQAFDDKCCKALLTADKSVPKETELQSLAKALMEVFPVGKKEGTSQYWKGNVKDVTLRLMKFFKLYGDKYTREEIIEAAKRYVSSYNGRYQYMRVLKYFIWKAERKTNSDGETYVEEVSDLASFIENADDEAQLREDWMSTLR